MGERAGAAKARRTGPASGLAQCRAIGLSQDAGQPSVPPGPHLSGVSSSKKSSLTKKDFPGTRAGLGAAEVREGASGGGVWGGGRAGRRQRGKVDRGLERRLWLRREGCRRLARCAAREGVRRLPGAEPAGRGGRPREWSAGVQSLGTFGVRLVRVRGAPEVAAGERRSGCPRDRRAAGAPRMSLRAGGETRRWPGPEQAACGGRSGGEESPRRGGASLHSRTRSHAVPRCYRLPCALASPAGLWMLGSGEPAALLHQPLL
ncbi:hypothetical protein H1C71_001059 [Ictidomys tridecemlineatus]|nr:hypothetical protein H1C71_001059 [Ictidomys tridecemlineatus]